VSDSFCGTFECDLTDSPTQGNDEEDVDDNMDFSKEEVEPRHTSSLARSASKPPEVFPSEAEYKACYI